MAWRRSSVRARLAPSHEGRLRAAFGVPGRSRRFGGIIDEMPTRTRTPATPRLLPAALAAALLGAATAHAAPAPRLRVDQVGYAVGSPARAYLMATGPVQGARFAVRSASGASVADGSVGRRLGAWSAAYPGVYAVDLPRTLPAGTYTVAVGGPQGAVSPAFTVAAARALYAGPLRNAAFFYGVQRDGPDFVRSPLMAGPAHLHDRRAMTYAPPRTNQDDALVGTLQPLGRRIDASGGWADAGDYLKFVETTSYTVDVLLAGVRDFPATMGRATRGDDLRAEARFGTRWLLRMWDGRRRTLYDQVGLGNGNDSITGDHDVWRLPQADDTLGGRKPADRYLRHRPVFRAGRPGTLVSPNLAGRDAAAFALCAQVFRRGAPRLAHRCLRAGEQIWRLADTHPAGRLTTTHPFAFYPETEWRDDLELGATELARATHGARSRRYLRQAARYARDYIRHAADKDALNLYDVAGLAHYELARRIAATPRHGALAVSRAALIGDLGRGLRAARRRGARDPFGFGFPWAAYDTASHGFGLSVMASEYGALTGSTAFAADGRRWLGNVLGANAWGVSLVIGDGTTFPHCPQHQQANLLGSLDGTGTVLAGAVVEGPNAETASGTLDGMRRCPPGGRDAFAPFDGAKARFEDDVGSYSTVEPAVDLSASSPLAFAWAAARPRWRAAAPRPTAARGGRTRARRG
jgi:endoglucanase